MDFGSFLRDVGRNVSNFFGGGRDEDEERRRRQQAAQRPSIQRPTFQLPQQNAAAPTVQTPQSLLDEPNRPQFTAPVLGGVSTNPDVARAQEMLKEGGAGAPLRPETINEARRINEENDRPSLQLEQFRPKPQPRPERQPKKDEPNLLQKFGAGFQQALSRVGDAALQGGSALTMGADMINPFISEERRQQKLREDIAAGELLRKNFASHTDITGNQLVGNRDVDEAAGRIAAGRGSAQDLAALAGRGLDIAGTTTMFVNPARTLSGAATANASNSALRTLIPNVAREATLYGGLEGTQAVADTYGQEGDIMKALQQFAPNFAIGAGSQLGLEGVAYGLGRGMRDIAGRTPLVRSVEEAAEDSARFIDDNRPAPIVADPDMYTPRKYDGPEIMPLSDSAITPPVRSANVAKPEAITSVNRPATVQAPGALSLPQAVSGDVPSLEMGIRMPETPQFDAPVVAPNEAIIAAQKAVDEANAQPAPLPVESRVIPAESPDAVQARALAEQATPINAEAVAADAARQAVNDAPTDQIASELGKMTQKAVQSGRQMQDADWEKLATDVGAEAERRAGELGTDIPTILEKVQRAFDNRKNVKSAKDAGLSEQEYQLYKGLANELTYLRNRTDPSLLGQGSIDRWYAPRQTTDTEYTPELVNEISRSYDGLKLKDLDLSTTPFEQAIRRYGDAPRVITNDVMNEIENVKITENGTTRITESGVKVPEEARAAFEIRSKQYVEKQDAVEKALANTDVSPQQIDRLMQAADKELDDAFAKLIESIPKNSTEGREAISRLQARRGAYIQSTIRTNMFSNIVNRALDHIGSNIVRATNQMAGIADSVASLASGRRALASGRAARGIAKNYAKGSLRRNLMRDFRTTVSMAGPNPIAKADAMFRAGGTLVTGSSDLTTTAVKMTNRMMLARAQAQGITDKAGMEKYLRENINSPEYKELLTGVNDIYNGYLGLPTSLTSRQGTNGRWLSNVDNLVNKGLEKFAPVLPERARRELNDLIMPALSGFAGATYRIGKKSLNASMAGVPGIYKGVKLMKEGGEASQQIGQMMVVRSMIDGLAGGLAGAATVGAMLSENMEWTGNYPSDDPNEAALWERQGIVPNSLRFNTGQKDENGNDVYLQIQPGRVLGPFALPVVLPAVIKSGGDVGEVFEGTLGQMLDNMGAEGVLRNAGNIGTALTGSGFAKEKAIENLMASAGFSLSSVVPLSGLQNNAANALDPNKRDTSGNRFTDSILNRNPLTRGGLPVKEDNLGDPVRNNTVLGSQAISTSVQPGTGEDSSNANPADAELQRLVEAGFTDVMPGKDVKQTTGQDDAKLLLGTDLYKNADDKTKASMLKDTLLGTKFKDFSTELDSKQRTALIEHKLLNEDQRKAWLDDNVNAANYYEADYKNLEAKGILSNDDKNLQNKSGAKYKMVEAKINQKYNVPYELKEMYQDISQSDFKDMLDPESDMYNPDRAKMLYKYDEIRAKAGVSRDEFTDKRKYSLDFKLGGRGRGGRGGKGSDKFTFASLPASLIGTGSSSSGTKAYADAAPTFKPIPDLKAPAPSEIPRGRTISVKKGIRI